MRCGSEETRVPFDCTIDQLKSTVVKALDSVPDEYRLTYGQIEVANGNSTSLVDLGLVPNVTLVFGRLLREVAGKL